MDGLLVALFASVSLEEVDSVSLVSATVISTSLVCKSLVSSVIVDMVECDVGPSGNRIVVLLGRVGIIGEYVVAVGGVIFDVELGDSSGVAPTLTATPQIYDYILSIPFMNMLNMRKISIFYNYYHCKCRC